jgi:hypothetical protein
VFRRRVLVDVSDIDTSVTILGRRHQLPVLLAPVALQRMAHPEGELATARAARAADTTMVLSTLASSTIEEVSATGVNRWFQLYIHRDLTKELVAGGCCGKCWSRWGTSPRAPRRRCAKPWTVAASTPRGWSTSTTSANPEVRQLLIGYLAHRTAAGMDYGSVRHLATNLVRNFWVAIEDINPDQPDLNLDEDTYQAWVAKPSHLSRAMPSVPRVRPLRLASTSAWRRVRIRSASRSSVVESVR